MPKWLWVVVVGVIGAGFCLATLAVYRGAERKEALVRQQARDEVRRRVVALKVFVRDLNAHQESSLYEIRRLQHDLLVAAEFHKHHFDSAALAKSTALLDFTPMAWGYMQTDKLTLRLTEAYQELDRLDGQLMAK